MRLLRLILLVRIAYRISLYPCMALMERSPLALDCTHSRYFPCTSGPPRLACKLPVIWFPLTSVIVTKIVHALQSSSSGEPPWLQGQNLSLESLLQKQRAEKEAASKVSGPYISSRPLSLSTQQPTILSKEQRAELATAKRAQEIKGQREREENTKKDREVPERGRRAQLAKWL
jgi:hypothetical protein